MPLKLAYPVMALAIVVFSAPAASGEGPPPEAFSHVNAALAENHIRPRYGNLLSQTTDFEGVTERLCTQPSSITMNEARLTFHALMDAWMNVEHLRFGPAELFLRVNRFHFWPEAHGRVDKVVAGLLAEEPNISPSRIENASAAGQGLMAAEVLLFSQGATESEPGGSTIGCRLLQAIATNMRTMAQGMDGDWWRGEPPFVTLFTGPGSDNPHFASHDEAALTLLASLHDGLQRIADLKLAPVVGNDIGSVRPYLAESRLSGRALRNIALNLEALHDLYTGGDGPGMGSLLPESENELDKLLRKGFRATLQTVRSIAGPLEEAAADPAQRDTVEKLLVQVRALRQIVRNRLTSALDLPIGFNALDGD